MTNILEVKNLTMHYETLDGDVDAVKNISFNVKAGESFGIVGESGCGKTSVAMSLLQLQAENGRISNGSILFDGIELDLVIAHARYETLHGIQVRSLN